MDKEIQYAINDLLDAVEEIAKIVRELNPGCVRQYDLIDFLLVRADRSLRELSDKQEVT